MIAQHVGMRHRFINVVAGLAIGLMLTTRVPAWADASGPLDGMVFGGKIGARDNPDLKDELHLQDGKFWSAICIRCGFKPGKYWVRREGDSLHFRGEFHSDRGIFIYAG